ncbi:transmembrane protein 85 [Aphelenchoides avenae]|nr:transmembrane protein 85 [Aphelenchus avenae]
MTYCASFSMASSNPMNKWRVDLTVGGSKISTRSIDQGVNPPGYNPGFVAAQQVEHASRSEQQQQHLLSKRAWDMALGPVKSLPMNMLMMYMAGNTISIFPIMMVIMAAWRPMKALMAVNMAFKPLEGEYAGSLLFHKVLFVLGNMAAIALAGYKCHSMGLLPNHASDWLDFVPPPERMQYVLFSGLYA